MSQIQGRTYANIFGLVERFINAKMLELSREHWLGDQKALEALVRFTDEELKHQEMFRRIERMIAAGMPAGYRFLPQPNDVARGGAGQVDLGGAGADLPHRAVHAGALPREHRAGRRACRRCSRTCSSSTGRRSRSTPSSTSWSGGARTRGSTPAARDRAVDDFIALVGAVDGILQAQAGADVAYFLTLAEPVATPPRSSRGSRPPCCRRTAGSTSSRGRSTRASPSC